jgi:16S rRNA (cytosine967-C5)-methyltransferase
VYAEDLVDRAAQRAGLSGPNRGLVFALVMAVLRHETLLDYWIGHLRDGKLDDGARVWLRIGLAQLFVMGMAPHAAVNETVEQAGRARGLVNAVLRRALREEAGLKAMREGAPASVRHSLPEFLAAKWEQRWGAEALEKLGEWNNTPAPVFVRVNGLHAKAGAAVAALPGAEPVEGYPGWYLVPEPPVRELQAGNCYAQDPSTGIAPLILQISSLTAAVEGRREAVAAWSWQEEAERHRYEVVEQADGGFAVKTLEAIPIAPRNADPTSRDAEGAR